jgi:IclR family transcriptional regulator, pca regulon regulatory protein
VTSPDAEPEVIAAVDRGLAVLASFRPDSPAMTLSEVARASDLDRASARRFLHTLLARGYLRADGAQFRLHPAVLELGNAYLAGLKLPRIAQPVLAALAGRFHEAASMAVLEGDEIVCVAHVPSGRLMGADVAIGSRAPAHGSVLGRVLLSGDEWVDGDEPEPGIRSVAAPIRDAGGATLAAIGMSLHTARVSGDEVVDTVRPALVDAAAAIERAYLSGAGSTDDLPEDAGQVVRPGREG